MKKDETLGTQLAKFQHQLEASSNELRLAKANMTKAQERLEVAEKNYEISMVAFANEVNTVREANTISKV
jgi:uncharacterized protein YPO0396